MQTRRPNFAHCVFIAVLLYGLAPSNSAFAVQGQPASSFMRQKEGLTISTSARQLGPECDSPLNTTGVAFELSQEEKKLVSLLHAMPRQNRGCEKWKKLWQTSKYTGGSPVVLTAAMNAALKCKDYQDGAEIYQRLRKLKIPMPLPTYSVAIKLLGKLKQVEEIEYLWDQLLKLDVVNHVVAGARIDAAADNGDIQAAKQVLRYMEEKNIEANVLHFSSSINACANANVADRAKEAQAFFDRMLANRVEPNVVTFVNLLRTFRDEPSECCLHLLADMKDHEVQPNRVFAENFLYIFLKKPSRKGCWTKQSVIASHLRKLNPVDLQFAKSFIDDLTESKVDLTKSCKLIDSALQSVMKEEFLQSEP